jgi:hypothetical protein
MVDIQNKEKDILKMSWKYETKSLADIYQLMEEHLLHPDYPIFVDIAKMAYDIAVFFENEGVNEELVKKYLNDELPYDALSKFHQKCMVLHQESGEDDIFSSSHKRWLYKLAKVKATWHWPDTQKDEALAKVMSKYDELQSLALSYESICQ